MPQELRKWMSARGENKRTISKQAFSKARQHLKPEAFIELVRLQRDTTFQTTEALETKNGYVVFAIDGSTLEVERTEETEQYFGMWSKTNACRARASVLVELSIGMIAQARIAPLSEDERSLAREHLKEFKPYAPEKTLVIYDRGYASKEIIQELNEMGYSYLFRLQESFSARITAMDLGDHRHKIPYKRSVLNVRIIKLTLPNGTVETLLTNLTTEAFRYEEFMALYFMRWGIETRYKSLKSTIEIEGFSGRSVVAIQQDFYASIYIANMLMLLKAASDIEIEAENADKGLKNEYQTNEKMGVSILKDKLIYILLDDNPRKRARRFTALVNEMKQYRSEVRLARECA